MAESGHESLWENEGKRSFFLSRNYGVCVFFTKHERLTDLHDSLRHRTKSQVTSRQRALVASLEQKTSGSVLRHRDSAHQIPDAHGPLSQWFGVLAY